jgi:NtrC-family two-component system response regulator AlgB
MATDSAKLRVLIIDDEANIRLTLLICLEAKGHTVVAHGTIDAALAEASLQPFDLVFLDLRLGVDNGMDYISQLLANNPWTKIVVITAYATIGTAVEAMKLGAADYLPKPFTPDQVNLLTQKIAERKLLEWKVQELQAALGGADPEADLPTGNTSMLAAMDLARRIAASNAHVLITGEIGTGRSRLARAIHTWSPRANGPFMVVNCDNPNDDAIDLELFGSSGDATEGPAIQQGKVAFCEGGTLVLNEIGALPPSMQEKIEVLLERKEYERHGEFALRRANIRVIAITSLNLQALADANRFRQSLLLALGVVHIELPALRHRPEDIAMLADRYLAFFSEQRHQRIVGFAPEARRAMEGYAWPGNARELRNMVERAVLLCRGEMIGLEHFSRHFRTSLDSFVVGDFVPLNTVEDLHIRRVYESAGSIKGAARILGIHETTMARWLKRFGGQSAPVFDEIGTPIEPADSHDEKPAR